MADEIGERAEKWLEKLDAAGDAGIVVRQSVSGDPRHVRMNADYLVPLADFEVIESLERAGLVRFAKLTRVSAHTRTEAQSAQITDAGRLKLRLARGGTRAAA